MELRTVTVLTPPGTAPVAVLALRGDPSVLPLSDDHGRPLAWPAPGRVRRGLVRDEEGAALDEVLAVGRSPGAELHVHGGAAVGAALLRRVVRAGFLERPCEPATAPGCWRLARAELSSRTGPMADLCHDARAALAAGCIDRELRERLSFAMSLAPFADVLCRPPVVRLVGPPNAGKSTLFNALLGAERALTSPAPGTTRDTVRATWSLRGVPVVLEDTAGGAPGREARADLVVDVLDRPGACARVAGAVEVLGRADLHHVGHPLRVSGLTGEGLPALGARLAESLGIPRAPARDLMAPVDPRQRSVLAAALALPAPGRRGVVPPS